MPGTIWYSLLISQKGEQAQRGKQYAQDYWRPKWQDWEPNFDTSDAKAFPLNYHCYIPDLL